MKTCGNCTMCCKLLGVRELPKPPMEWCKHCDKGTGCTIYGMRPQTCQDYECLYLQAFDAGVEPPIHLRPDKCKVVISPGFGETSTGEEVITVHVDPGFPHAWKSPAVFDILCKFALDGAHVVIATDASQNRTLMVPVGPDTVGTKQITMSPPDENGVQHYILGED